jgi:hypothetical protein
MDEGGARGTKTLVGISKGGDHSENQRRWEENIKINVI